jgi:hypothetical protein
MKKKYIPTLTIIILSLFIIPTVYSKKGSNPLDELWEAVNDLIFRVTALEENSGDPDISALEAQIEALESRVSELERELSHPPIIDYLSRPLAHQGMPHTFEWTVLDPDGDDFTGELRISEASVFTFTKDNPIESHYEYTCTFNEVGLFYVEIVAIDEHGTQSSSLIELEVINYPPMVEIECNDGDPVYVGDEARFDIEVVNEEVWEVWTGELFFAYWQEWPNSFHSIPFTKPPGLDSVYTVHIYYTFEEIGDYIVRVEMTDDYGSGYYTEIFVRVE